MYVPSAISRSSTCWVFSPAQRMCARMWFSAENGTISLRAAVVSVRENRSMMHGAYLAYLGPSVLWTMFEEGNVRTPAICTGVAAPKSMHHA